MRIFSLALLLVAVSLDVRAQVALTPPAPEQIKAIVRGFGTARPKVTVLTHTLMVVRGKVVGSNAWSFDIKSGKRVFAVEYENVLELQGGGATVSFVPAQAARNYGTWTDVRGIFPGTRIAIVFKDGTTTKAFANSASDAHLIAVDEKGRQRVDFPRDTILAVYGLVGGYGGVKAGASKGAEGMTTGRDQLLHGAFAGIGALIGLVKSDGRPVLVYSR